MEESLTYRRWTVSVNRALTAAAYAAVPEGSPETCGCDPCRNFALGRERIYPVAVRELLTQLGIDWHKEAEVYHNGQVRPEIHSYGGWFHFTGRIEAGSDCWNSITPSAAVPEFEHVLDGFSLGFGKRVVLPRDSFRGQELVQVEFLAETRWTVEAQEVA